MCYFHHNTNLQGVQKDTDSGSTGPIFLANSLTFKAVFQGGGHSHRLGYAYARMARVWFLSISVLERAGF